MSNQLHGLAVSKGGSNIEVIEQDPGDISKGNFRFIPVGSTVKESWTNTSGTKTFSGPRYALFIANDGATDITLVVNGLTFTIKQTETFDERFDVFTSITITTTSAYRAWARG